jgi:hypothetical protein
MKRLHDGNCLVDQNRSQSLTSKMGVCRRREREGGEWHLAIRPLLDLAHILQREDFSTATVLCVLETKARRAREVLIIRSAVIILFHDEPC